MEGGNTARTAAQKWTVNNMELIDKNALVKYLEGMGNEIYAGNDEYFIGQKAGLMKVVGVVMTFPTVEERKEEQKYCWNCGAIMDGKAICDD